MSLDPRKLCQLELPAADLKRAVAFYDAALGWRPVPAEIHELVVLEVPEGCPFGIAIVPGKVEGTRGGVVPYFSVDDPEAVLAAVDAAGGKRLGQTPLPGYGRLWQFEDTEGNRLGLYSATLSKA